MAAQVSLLAYLQHGPPAIPVIDQGQSTDNTTHHNYPPESIIHVGHWSAFSLDNILQQYRAVLKNSQIEDEAMPLSAPQRINSETGVRHRFNLYLESRVRRSLRNDFNYLVERNQLGNRTVLSFGEGNLAQIIDSFTPDLSFFDPTLPASVRPNCVPGDLKPSYKWSLSMRDGPTLYKRRQFRQVLVQINFYMNQHQTLFGYILTDRELVAVRRFDDDGALEVSDSIAWSTKGDESHLQLTVLLALWYLGMLGSGN